MKPLSPELEADLIAYYRSLPSITNKLGLAGALAYSGGGASVDLLIYSLTQEYAGRSSESPREVALVAGGLPRYLGLAAAHSERAYQFLRDGLNPSFWATNSPWSTPSLEPSYALPQACIAGLVISGRDDAWQMVLNLKYNPDSNYVRNVCGAICDAAFEHAMMAEMGREEFLDNPLEPNDSIHRMGQWWKTPAGKEWHEWMERVQGITNAESP